MKRLCIIPDIVFGIVAQGDAEKNSWLLAAIVADHNGENVTPPQKYADLWTCVKSAVDMMRGNYAKRMEARSKAGKMGGAPTGNCNAVKNEKTSKTSKTTKNKQNKLPYQTIPYQTIPYQERVPPTPRRGVTLSLLPLLPKFPVKRAGETTGARPSRPLPEKRSPRMSRPLA